MIYKDPDFKDLYISGTVSMEVQWKQWFTCRMSSSEPYI